MSKTTALGILETVIAVCLAVQALPATAWEDPKVWVTALCLAAAKTLKEVHTADTK